MKTFFTFCIAIFALCNIAICQCPPQGLKIITPICDSPRNLKVTAATCKYIDVRWNGSKTQTYHVRASYMDASINRLFEIAAKNISCGDNGICKASIPVKEAVNVNWTVQAVCSKESAILYSYQLNGPQAYTPVCEKATDSSKNNIHVYPNPTTGILTVEYNGKVSGNLEFSIFDMSGKMVFHKPADANSKSSTRYQLDLHNLVSGTYLLEAKSGRDVNIAKFVMLKN